MPAAVGAAVPFIEGLFAPAVAGAGAGAVGTTAAAAAGAALPEVTVSATSLAASGAAGGVSAAGAAGLAGGAATAGALASGAAAGVENQTVPIAGSQPAPTNAVIPPGGQGSPSILRTISEATTAAAGASSLYQLATGAGRVQIPPMPMTPQPQIDQSVQAAEQEALARRAAAGGLQSTVGTGPGQAGAVLNPATTSSRSLLGG